VRNCNHTWTLQRPTVATPAPLFESVSAELFASKPTTDVAHLDSSTNRCLSAKCLTCCHIKNANSFSAATIISIISRKCHVCWSGSSHALAHDLHRMLYVNCHQSAAQVPRTRASTAWRLWSHRAWPKLLKDSTKKGPDQKQQHIDQPSWNMKGCERRRNLVEILLPEKWPPQICLIEAPLGIIASLRLWWLCNWESLGNLLHKV